MNTIRHTLLFPLFAFSDTPVHTYSMGKLEKTSPLQYSETSSENFDISAELNLQLLQHELIKKPKLSLDECVKLISESIGDAKEILDSGEDLPKDHPLVQIMIPKN